MSEIVPYDWCDECDIPVEGEAHVRWHEAGGSRLPGQIWLRPGYRREDARSVVRPR